MNMAFSPYSCWVYGCRRCARAAHLDRPPHNIGDLACTTPLVAALRAQLPRAWLAALVTTYNAEVLARNPALDEIFVYEKLKHRSGGLIAHVRNRIGQISRLRREKLDCVLCRPPRRNRSGSRAA